MAQNDDFGAVYEGVSAEDKHLFPEPSKAQAMLNQHSAPGTGDSPMKVNIGGDKKHRNLAGADSRKAEFASRSPANIAADMQASQQPFGADFANFDPYSMGYGMQPPMPPNMYMHPNMYMNPWMTGMMGPAPMNPWMMMPPPNMAGGKGGKGGGMYGGNAFQNQQRGGAGGQKPGKKDRDRRKRHQGQGAPQSSDAAGDGEEAHVEGSPQLEEVRKHGHGSNCKLELKDVMDNLLEFAKDQHGSRFLQTKLENATGEQKADVFAVLLPETARLANDVFGNYVLQKLFDICTSDQKKQLAERLKGEVFRLSKLPYGCRVVQKALQSVPRDQQVNLANELKTHVTECIEDQNGNHVIQKCIEQMPPDSVNFIIQAIVDRDGGGTSGGSKEKEEVCRLAMHVFGCRVIQRLLEHCASAKQLDVILEKIMENIASLSEHAFGNYVIQHVLEHGRVEDKRNILNEIREHILEYSKKKSSSNVVEKCLEIATIGEHANQLEGDRKRLMDGVLDRGADSSPPLVETMSKDKFGNYIVQRMIDYTRGPEREKLLEILTRQADDLKSLPVGKHIIDKLRKEDPGNPKFVADSDNVDAGHKA